MFRRRIAVFLGVALASGWWAAGLRGQQARPSAISTSGTASLSGRVMSDETPARPVRRAAVRVVSAGDPFADRYRGQSVITGDDGRFAFADLPAGRYTISASRPGFVPTAYGAKRSTGTGSTISLTDGQRVSDLTLILLRGAAVTGTVSEQDGSAASGQSVAVMRYAFDSTGRRTLVRDAFAQTDDRGVYRVFGLAPGTYLVVVTQSRPVTGNLDFHVTTDADVQWARRAVVDGGRGATISAAPASAPNLVYVPIFYPGTPLQANAVTITMQAGQERAGVDIPLIRASAASLEGTVATEDGQVPSNMQVNLLAHERIDGLAFYGFTPQPSVQDGKFMFQGLTPRTYTVAVRVNQGLAPGARGGTPPTPAMLALYGLSDVTMGEHDQAVAVTLRPGVTVSGRIAFDGTAAAPSDLTGVRVSLESIPGASGVAIGVPGVSATGAGAFSFAGVAPGRYRVTASVPASGAPGGWQPRSVLHDGHDAMDEALDVSTSDVAGLTLTFTDHPAELSGTIQDAAGRPTPEYFVIVFPRNKSYWTPQGRRIQAKRPGNDGRFTFSNLPPGDYLIGAVTDVEQGQWYDPTFLTEFGQSAIPLTIGEGERKVQDIRAAQ